MENLISKADYVINCLPFTSETKNIFDLDLFKKMKTSAVYVNIGRGQTTNEQHLIAALEQRLIRAAILDVFEKEPLDE